MARTDDKPDDARTREGVTRRNLLDGAGRLQSGHSRGT
jgi:hypothetical protein